MAPARVVTTTKEVLRALEDRLAEINLERKKEWDNFAASNGALGQSVASRSRWI